MEWHIKKGIQLNLTHFIAWTRDSGDWKKKNSSKKEFLKLLQGKIENISFERILEDIIRFIRDDRTIEI